MLITPSLYNAYYFFVSRENSKKEDFLNALNKVYSEPSKLMQDGIDFENAIREKKYKYMQDDDLPCCTDLIKEADDIVGNGFWNVSCKKQLDDNLLYGKIDVLKLDTIYDIKLCMTYELGKYQYSIQHLIYMYCTGLKNFKYIITDRKKLYIEQYNWYSDSETILRTRINDMLEFIMSNEEFKQPFLEKWVEKR